MRHRLLLFCTLLGIMSVSDIPVAFAEPRRCWSRQSTAAVKMLPPTNDSGNRVYWWIGDSRFVGMAGRNIIGNKSNEAVLAQTGKGLTWFNDTAKSKLTNCLHAGDVVILGLGANDIYKTSQYINIYKQLITNNPNVTFKILSVNPVYDGGSSSLTNSAIEQFNSALQSAFPDNFIDTYTELKNRINASNTDGMGVHYTNRDIEQSVYDTVIRQVGGETGSPNPPTPHQSTTTPAENPPNNTEVKPHPTATPDPNAALLAAVKNKTENVDAVLTALKNSANINARDPDGWTALMLAAAEGNNNIIKTLIENKANINAQSQDGWTALMIASARGHRNVINTLLKQEGLNVTATATADTNNADAQTGMNALMLATVNMYKEIVADLLGADGINHGVNINATAAPGPYTGMTALMLAASNGFKEIVDILISKHANACIKDAHHKTALDWAKTRAANAAPNKKPAYEAIINALEQTMKSQKCPNTPGLNNTKSNLDSKIAEINNISASLSQFNFNKSHWKNASGGFNTARLASDSVAGVVLGTAGGLITSSIIKKNQTKSGFENIQCTINGNYVASYGDDFVVGGQL